jgi:hypothetical protein
MYVGDLVRLSVLGRLVDRIGRAGLLVPDRRDQLLAQPIGGPQVKDLLQFVEHVDRAGLRAGELRRLGDDGG